jgi:hypothetical protein
MTDHEAGIQGNGRPRGGLVTALLCSLPALVLGAVLLVPFRDKAFTIDDTLFLRQAEHALSDPLHPTAFEMVWFEKVERLSSLMPSGPVMAYLLVPAVARGGAEALGHLVVFVCLALGVLATVRLALRVGLSREQAALAGLLVVTAPAVLGMAGTCMPDVPAMALGVLGMERLWAWREGRRLDQALCAAVLLALAALCRSHLSLLLGAATLVCAGDEVFDWRRWLRRDLAPWRRLVREAWPIGLALFLAWCVTRLCRDPLPDAASLAGSAWRFITLRKLNRHLLSYALGWAMSMPLVLPWLFVRRTRMRWSLIWQAAPVAVMLFSLAGEVRWMWLTPLAVAAVVVVADIFERAWRERDLVGLACGAWLLLPLPVLIYNNFAPKYLVPSAPAVALLVAGLLGRVPRRWGRALGIGTACAGALVGVLILRADAAFAGFQRRAVAELIAPEVARGHRVWIAGHWGYQWYAERAGARYLATMADARPGDLLVIDRQADSERTLRGIPWYSRRLVRWIADSTPGGRIISRAAGAGFYSNGYGFFPWAWSDDELDRFEVWVME